jgi:hypothetical protein
LMPLSVYAASLPPKAAQKQSHNERSSCKNASRVPVGAGVERAAAGATKGAWRKGIHVLV